MSPQMKQTRASARRCSTRGSAFAACVSPSRSRSSFGGARRGGGREPAGAPPPQEHGGDLRRPEQRRSRVEDQANRDGSQERSIPSLVGERGEETPADKLGLDLGSDPPADEDPPPPQ